ncbi:MAG: hypothetical protein HY051_05835 [Candidatus Aenigmarchaeota archaeon]|nr:hypothetical protein [Candidatus Aenigmarchaeota archaeon]
MVNSIKKFFLEAAAEVAFEEMKDESPREFARWREAVVKHGPPTNLSGDERVYWDVYLSRLGLDPAYKERHAVGPRGYRK